MPVIHGAWARGALFLWAEDPDLPPTAGNGASAAPPRPHPFACQAAELADLLASRPGTAVDAVRKAVHDEFTLQLPSAAGGPLASPELVRPEGGPGDPVGRGKIALARWRVPGLAFRPADALAVLGDLGRPDDTVAAGGSLTYLAAVARFAAALAARGRVLPVITTEGDTYAARWRPALGGTDAQRARDLAAALPPACRAAGGEAPGALLADMLDALADAAARARLPQYLLPARRGRAPARVPMTERYVVALTSADARIDVATAQDRAEAAELAAELDAWRDGARIPAGPVRTCFRLIEPDPPDSGSWRVEFALQSAEDPSLMVHADDVWAGAGAGFGGGDPVEQLLAGLGAAARLFGELEHALREPAPAAVELDTPGAFRFL
ncbi:MAG: ATP-dependent helicase, partial [Actinobacteria bacterium]|nr:ATP-dependent helicase [Actinomycetota bacterium]